MTYASQHLAYTFEGDLPGSELWTITLRTVAAVGDDSECAAMALQANEAFTTFWNATGGIHAFNPAGVTFRKVTCRSVSAAGVTVAQGESSLITPSPGIASSQGAPNQSALVVTLVTARPGRTGRGRVYLPFLSPIFQAGTDRIADTGRDAVCFSFSAFITTMNLNDDGGTFGPFDIAVQSTVNMAAPPPVTSVRVGNVVDTQRRRRNKVVEQYQTSGV